MQCATGLVLVPVCIVGDGVLHSPIGHQGVVQDLARTFGCGNSSCSFNLSSINLLWHFRKLLLNFVALCPLENPA